MRYPVGDSNIVLGENSNMIMEQNVEECQITNKEVVKELLDHSYCLKLNISINKNFSIPSNYMKSFFKAYEENEKYRLYLKPSSREDRVTCSACEINLLPRPSNIEEHFKTLVHRINTEEMIGKFDAEAAKTEI